MQSTDLPHVAVDLPFWHLLIFPPGTEGRQTAMRAGSSQRLPLMVSCIEAPVAYMTCLSDAQMAVAVDGAKEYLIGQFCDTAAQAMADKGHLSTGSDAVDEFAQGQASSICAALVTPVVEKYYKMMIGEKGVEESACEGYEKPDEAEEEKADEEQEEFRGSEAQREKIKAENQAEYDEVEQKESDADEAQEKSDAAAEEAEANPGDETAAEAADAAAEDAGEAAGEAVAEAGGTDMAVDVLVFVALCFL